MLASFIDLFVHLDTHLNAIVTSVGVGFYGVLFLIIFCETGLVVTPFLPGDSLLFATGALAAIDGSILRIDVLIAVCFAAALCGDLCNYTIGRRIGPRLFAGRLARFFNKRYLDQTTEFYARHGGKTVVLARFIPIVRTFAPFVAGLGGMRFRRFAAFSVTGAMLWIIPFLTGGFFLGNTPVVKTNFHIVVLGIIAISVMPAVLQVIKARRAGTAGPAGSAKAPGPL